MHLIPASFTIRSPMIVVGHRSVTHEVCRFCAYNNQKSRTDNELKNRTFHLKNPDDLGKLLMQL